jgi:hypothetical protein
MNLINKSRLTQPIIMVHTLNNTELEAWGQYMTKVNDTSGSTCTHVLTKDEMGEGLKKIDLILGKPNIKIPGGDAWSGGGLRVDEHDGKMWLSTFDIGRADLAKKKRRSYGGCVEYKARVEELTTGWVVGQKGIKGCLTYFPSRSLDITHKSVEEFVRIVESFQ